MNRALRVDIHIHTRASDGVWTVGQLADEVVREGIDLFAATDHNTVANVTAAQREAERLELYFLPAVELDTTFDGAIFHILGYGIDHGSPGLLSLLEHNRRLLAERDMEILRQLERRGYPIDWQAYGEYRNDPSRGGFKTLNFCIDQGFCRDVADFFTRLFNREQPIPHPVFPASGEAIRSILEAGGTPVLAHPYGSIGGEYDENRLHTFARLKEEGLRGLECYSTYHSSEQIRSARQFCERQGLLITGGSDSHGPFTAKRKLGTPYVTTEELRLGEIGEKAGLPAAVLR